MRAVLKVNCPSIRKRLIEAGLDLCLCCEFNDAVWLSTDSTGRIHGEGYEWAEADLFKVEDVLADFEKENPYTDFGYNVEEFINWCKEFKKI